MTDPTPPFPDGPSALERVCDGLCLDSSDIGVPGYGIAYPHPGCPLHDPDSVCDCGTPDRCLSPTHGQIPMVDALRIRHAQRVKRIAELEALRDGDTR